MMLVMARKWQSEMREGMVGETEDRNRVTLHRRGARDIATRHHSNSNLGRKEKRGGGAFVKVYTFW
jgi:hypothetical protein